MNNQQIPIFITGPFKQLLTMDHLPLKGSLKDAQLEIIEKAGVVHQAGIILEIGLFGELCAKYNSAHPEIQYIESDMIALPGLVDAHTHLCWAGSRENDYAMRLEGKSYTEIVRSGGGIWDTVTKTRNATDVELKMLLKMRADRQLANGITTCEVKTGYALNPEGEILLLEIIRSANQEHSIDLVSTCLAAHIKPKDFDGGATDYLQILAEKLLPIIKKEKLTNRIDIFVEEGAFGVQEAGKYLLEAKKMGFELVVHGEQFTSGGVSLAVKVGAKSVDHLEMIGVDAITELAASEVVAMALPGASIGLGCQFAPARKLLDAGCCLAIGSDWNPGSAPMGDLLIQTAILGTFEKLSNAEQLSAITFRAAHALNLSDRGILKKRNIADFIGFPGRNYREILYQQGMLKPTMVWESGNEVTKKL
ncbi:MAG: imidazolonepropionase [Prolixibacteraceae bacterium]|jgi:imidazolonepropionase|nr:imidazolonepropionase [Prolixibacteraceae bacterium]